jgi:hypothetical protein
LEPLYALQTNIYSWQAVCRSPGGKHLALQIGPQLYLLESLTGRLLGTTRLPDPNPHGHARGVAFREDGSKLMTITATGSLVDLHIWDLATGRHERELLNFPVGSSRVTWATDDRVLFNDRQAVDLQRGLAACDYSIPTVHTSLAGRGWYVAVKDERGFQTHQLLNLDLPEATVMQQARKYNPAQFLAIKPGEQVSVQIENAGALDTEKIRTLLARKIESNGWIVAAEGTAAPFTLRCKLANPDVLQIPSLTKEDRHNPVKRKVQYSHLTLSLSKKGFELTPIWQLVHTHLENPVVEEIGGQFTGPTIDYFADLRIPKQLLYFGGGNAIFQGSFNSKGIVYSQPRL